MDEKERGELLALKRELERQLRILDREILEYPPAGDQKKFNFKVKKAIRYRDTIQSIQKQVYGN